MNIKFKHLKIENFKNHNQLEMLFEDITNILGRNGVGKTTIGDAITYLLFGTDILGTKLDPKPIGKNNETKVELLLNIDGTDFLLGKTQKKTAKPFINEVPKTATEFKQFIDSLFDKSLFLSLFSPMFFFTQHWQEQRSLLLSFISEPLNKDVLKVMSKVQAETLGENLKKYSLDDLEKKHRDRFNKTDKAYERAAERVLTLNEQYEKIAKQGTPNIETIKKEIDVLISKRDKLDEDNQKEYQTQIERNKIQSQIDSLELQITRQKQLLAQIKEEAIAETCSTCGQSLENESIQKVKDDRRERYNKEVLTGKDLVKQYNLLIEKLTLLPEPKTIDRSKSFELDEQVTALHTQYNLANQAQTINQDMEDAKANAEKIRVERNDSVSTIDAIKAFRAKRTDLMVSKVDDLFNTISVRLYEPLKNGEEKPTFEIEMDGKPYSKLSTAEKIKAGLELIEVLSTQSSVITPTFVDNAESILNFVKPTGQLIVARVADKEFEIKTDSLKGEKVNE